MLPMAEEESSTYTSSYSDGDDNGQDHVNRRRDSYGGSLKVSHNDCDDDQCRRRCDDEEIDSVQYSDQEAEEEEEEEESRVAETIALFGADGCTGHHFLRLALDAGYRVRALVAPSTKLEGDFEDLYTVIGTLNDDAKVQEVVYSSTYVVSMVGESVLAKSGDYPRDCLLKFSKTLYRIMQRQDEHDIRGFLFQSTSLAANQWGELPFFAKFIRAYFTRRRYLKYLDDLDAVTRFVYSKSWGDKKVAFPYVITRPTSFLRDGRSTKKLQASRSVRMHVYT
jgi:NAD(P)H-binding